MPTLTRIVTDLLSVAALVATGVALPASQQLGLACLATAAEHPSVQADVPAAAPESCEQRLAKLERTQPAGASSRSFCDEGTLITVEAGSVAPLPLQGDADASQAAPPPAATGDASDASALAMR